MKFDQDLCKTVRTCDMTERSFFGKAELNPRVRSAFGNVLFMQVYSQE